MNFKELLEKYKDGSASAEEIKLIKEELEKYEAIEEYLTENCNIGFEKDISVDNIKKETNFVKSSMNKKLRKVILASVSIVFIILFSVFYIISPMINNFYYNPTKNTVSKGHKDLYFDLKVFTELNLPGYSAGGGASSESLGFGKYNIFFERTNLFTGEVRDVNAKIKRNAKIGSYQDFFTNDIPGFLSIRDPNFGTENFLEEQKGLVIDHFKELNPVSYISANITFQKDLSMKELIELKQKYNNKINFKWVGIRTEAEGKVSHYLFGFYPGFNDGSVSSDSADKSKYPYLQLIDWVTDKENKNKFDMEEAYNKHFTSLLKYINDRQKAVKALDQNNDYKVQYYKNALKYVEKNGLSTYGVLVYGEARELLQFLDNEKVKAIEINDILPSKNINKAFLTK